MASLSHIVRTAQFALNAVSDSFSPPKAATSKTVRINGLVCIIFGAICVAAFGGMVLLLNANPSTLLFPSLLAYAFFTVGGYRLIRGKEPEPSHSAEVSLPRILLGCISVVFCFGLLVGMGFVADLLFHQ